jgi:hypothetical protein
MDKMDKKSKCILIGGGFMIFTIIIVTTLITLIVPRVLNPPIQKLLTTTGLLNELTDNNLTNEWNIFNKTYALIKPLNSKVIRVIYPKNSYNPSGSVLGGFNFYAQPIDLFNKARFQYKVFFKTRFNWVKGGKLPGLWIGERGANGGTNITDGASVRMMWRRNGEAEVYIYAQKQLTEFYQLPGYVGNNDYGVSLWRGLLNFKTNQWNNVTIYIENNTGENYNGLLRVSVNNTTFEYNKICWTLGGLPIGGLMMQSFFGGSDSTWATPVAQEVLFRDFVVANY